MTLAIAAEFPWGHWRQIPASLPGSRFACSGVILAADTRWSYDKGAPFDRGRKLWLVEDQVGFVLAGDVVAGEDGVNSLRNDRRNRPFSSVKDLIDRSRIAFEAAYDENVKIAKVGKRAKCGSLFYLMGVVDKQGDSVLFRFSSESSFAPIELHGVHAVGMPTAVESARKYLLKDAMEKTDLGTRLTSTSEPWAMTVGGCIGEAIDSDLEMSVGGSVQIAIGEPSGWREIGLSELSDGQDAEINDSWRDRTLPLATLNSATSRASLQLASCETADLIMEQIA